MFDKYILDENGNPVVEGDLFKWASWYQNFGAHRRVARTVLRKFWVSTVFLALDHSFTPGAIPILYETMVSHKNKNTPMNELWVRRYATAEGAKEGHEKGVAFAKRKEAVFINKSRAKKRGKRC